MSRFDFVTHHIETSFGNIAIHTKGPADATRALVFFHGHLDTAIENGSYKIFDSYDDTLQILVDHRWHGCSTRTVFYPALSERAEDIDIVLEAISQLFPQITKINLIGYSQGGSVLLLYLLGDHVHKHKIESAFLVAPRIDLKRYLKWFEKEIPVMEAEGRSSFTKKYKSKGYINYNKKYIDEFATFNFYEMMDRLTTKTVLIRGEQDDLITEPEAHKLRDLNPKYLKYFSVKDWKHNFEPHHWHELYGYIYQSVRTDHSLTQQVPKLIMSDTMNL
jgi:pimeloyl-ACP methyl ester carboxylesterase